MWFRDVNERLEQRVLEEPVPERPFEIVCECDREECTERIPIRLTDYEAVRATPTEFIVAPGHADPVCERTVASTEAYQVVEKRGEAAIVAERENPRG